MVIASRRRRSIEDDGFSLIELLVVVIIIGILAGIVIPTLLSSRERSYKGAVISSLRDAATAEEAYATSSAGSYSGSLSDLTDEGFQTTTHVTVSPNVVSGGVCLSGWHADLASGAGSAGHALWWTNQGNAAGNIQDSRPPGC